MGRDAHVHALHVPVHNGYAFMRGGAGSSVWRVHARGDGRTYGRAGARAYQLPQSIWIAHHHKQHATSMERFIPFLVPKPCRNLGTPRPAQPPSCPTRACLPAARPLPLSSPAPFRTFPMSCATFWRLIDTVPVSAISRGMCRTCIHIHMQQQRATKTVEGRGSGGEGLYGFRPMPRSG